MIKRFILTTRQKIRSAVQFGKRRSLSFLPAGLRRSRDNKKETIQEAGVPVKPPVKHEKQPLEDGVAPPAKKRTKKKKRWKLEDFPVTPLPGKVRFHDIGLPLQLMRAIADLDFQYCTPVQAESLPHILDGNDLVAHANTGTGKTAVFLIAILTNLLNQPNSKRAGRVKALVIAPTRELVVQIAKDGKKLARYSHHKIVAIYGGADYQRQMDLLQKGIPDIVVATPGRLLDFASKGALQLSGTETLVIDEADRMLDMGFIPDVRRIVHLLPDRRERQTLMFSATITEDVKRLAAQWCKNPANVAIEPEQVAVESVEQLVYLVTGGEKYTVLYNLIKQSDDSRIVVFANQKVEAKKLYERLQRNNIDCALLTGDVPQKKRLDRLERFRSARVRVLVATDVAGRGIHIEGITHVVNYSLPYEPEDYVHRIGRTGRAGAAGISISFACEEGGFILPDIEEFIGRKLDCVVPQEELLQLPPKGTAKVAKKGNYRKKKYKKRPHRYHTHKKKPDAG